jgi:DNA polymerase
VQSWDLSQGGNFDPSVLTEPLIGAHNAVFEQLAIENCCGEHIGFERWRCTMIMAFALSLPGDLGRLAQVLQLGDEYQKDKEGKRLIQKFCKPRKPTKTKPYEWSDWTTDPEDWKKFVHYCEQDVIAERACFKRMRKYDE